MPLNVIVALCQWSCECVCVCGRGCCICLASNIHCVRTLWNGGYVAPALTACSECIPSPPTPYLFYIQSISICTVTLAVVVVLTVHELVYCIQCFIIIQYNDNAISTCRIWMHIQYIYVHEKVSSTIRTRVVNSLDCTYMISLGWTLAPKFAQVPLHSSRVAVTVTIAPTYLVCDLYTSGAQCYCECLLLTLVVCSATVSVCCSHWLCAVLL